jgi:hypothetical protein
VSDVEDADLRKAISDAVNSHASAVQANLTAVKRMISLRAQIQSAGSVDTAAVMRQTKGIKASPLYQDSGVSENSNWLADAFRHLADLFHFHFNPPETNALPSSGLDVRWFAYIVIGLAAIAVVGFAIYAVTRLRWRKGLKRKATALLEEDEPDRSADEWLLLADSLTNEARYREAVRCLFLACLLKFDEYGIARFERSHTNWEHLARVQASPKRPPELDFLPPTQMFDRVWYGMSTRGLPDVEQFKIWYSYIVDLVGEKAA